MTRQEPYFQTAPVLVYAFASCVVGVLACWPILINGSVLVFFDIDAYLSSGAAISGVLADFLGTTPETATPGDAGADTGPDRGRSIRSIVYSAYAFFGALTPLGAVGPVLVQSALVAALALLLVPAQAMRRPALAFVTLLGLLLLTPWPFYASLFMPDLLTAAVLIGAMILIRGTNRRGHIVVGGMLCFALSSHYGNPPLALALLGCVGVWLAVSRRLTTGASLAMALPFVFTVAVNMVGSTIAFGEASVAPRRLPILLARSLEDGPARWHLEQDCETYNYEICSALEVIPDDVGEALWQEGGLAQISSAEVIGRIRAEEPILLWRAFLDYPVAQTWSLGRNAALQMVRFGLSDVYAGHVMVSADGTYDVALDQDTARRTLDALEWLHIGVVLLSIVILLSALRNRDCEMHRIGAMATVLCLGLILNAGIFGGLSAPVDRYQGRIIWLLPLLAVLTILSRKTVADDS